MSERPAARRPLLGLLLAALLAGSLTAAAPASAQVVPAALPSSWTIGFGSIGPVTTRMTVAQAIHALHSKASSTTAQPYCGLFGLTGDLPTGLAGFAPRRGGKLAMVSIGFLLGGSRKGLPKVVQTSRGVRLGSSLAALNAAYPHVLSTTTDYSNTVKVLRGPEGLAIAFEISGGKVANIATGEGATLTQGEYCG